MLTFHVNTWTIIKNYYYYYYYIIGLTTITIYFLVRKTYRSLFPKSMVALGPVAVAQVRSTGVTQERQGDFEVLAELFFVFV